ncbi:MAG: glutamine-hydrolyzing carbamoyl-phosphate synthase small subunit [Thermodesulfobacteriota bacterium]
MPNKKDKNNNKAILALSDGTIFEGLSFGFSGEAVAEICFNTSMTGYQEILTDPSYKGQIVSMTYPQIGNYGINSEDVESRRPWVEGFIVKEVCPEPSSWRSEKSLDAFMLENGIVGISGIDTRALTRLIRDKGAMEGVISAKDLDPKSLVKKARAHPGLTGRDLVSLVTTDKPYKWDEGLWNLEGVDALAGKSIPQERYKVVAFDFGMKLNILRNLVSIGCDVTVVSASTTAKEVLAMAPDGVFLSNGPGDPEAVTYAVETVKELLRKLPVFGICLGHQIISLALGAKSFKLKFGHRGANQPVKDLNTGKVEITSQNHGFAIDAKSMKGLSKITHVNLNDDTVEGLSSPGEKFFSVQYHPESSPGPHDSRYLFMIFLEMMICERHARHE